MLQNIQLTSKLMDTRVSPQQTDADADSDGALGANLLAGSDALGVNRSMSMREFHVLKESEDDEIGEEGVVAVSKFITTVAYVFFFPLSELALRLREWCACLCGGRSSEVRSERDIHRRLATGASVPCFLYWAYLALFLLLQNDLFGSEVLIPAVLMFMIAVDTSIALTNPILDRYLKFVTYLRGELPVEQWFSRLLPLAAVIPQSLRAAQHRRFLKSLKVALPVVVPEGASPSDDWDLLTEEVSVDPSTFKNRGNDDDKSQRQVDLEKYFDASMRSMGKSYVEQLMSHDGPPVDVQCAARDAIEADQFYADAGERVAWVRLETVADQLIYGVRRRPSVTCCSGSIGQFVRYYWSPLYPFLGLAALAFILLSATIPTGIRKATGQLSGLDDTEWFLVAFYMVLVIVLSGQLSMIFFLLNEGLRKEWRRRETFGFLLEPDQAQARFLPKLKLTHERHATAVYALHRYVTIYSQDNVAFLMYRVSFIGLMVIVCIGYLGIAWAQGTLRETTVFTSFTIVTFVAFVLFFLPAAFFGLLANGTRDDHKHSISRQIMDNHQQHFLVYDDGRNHDGAIDVLLHMRAYLDDIPLLAWLGKTLDGEFLATVGSGLAVIGAAALPVLVENFFDD